MRYGNGFDGIDIAHKKSYGRRTVYGCLLKCVSPATTKEGTMMDPSESPGDEKGRPETAQRRSRGRYYVTNLVTEI